MEKVLEFESLWTFHIYIANASYGTDESRLTKKESSRLRSRKTVVFSFVLIGILIMGAVTYAGLSSTSASSNFGGLGSAHEHATFLVLINGTAIDFGQEMYQVKSQYIHVENSNGMTLHKHATQVPVGEFLKSLGMKVTDSCFVMDTGLQYCENGDKKLRAFVNRVEGPPSSIMNYVIRDNDRFLIIYDNAPEQTIELQLNRLDGIPISK